MSFVLPLRDERKACDSCGHPIADHSWCNLCGEPICPTMNALYAFAEVCSRCSHESEGVWNWVEEASDAIDTAKVLLDRALSSDNPERVREYVEKARKQLKWFEILP